MNPNLVLWLHAVALLALQIALVLALTAATQPLLRPARAKRAAWLAGFLGLSVVLVNSLLGLDRQIVELVRSHPDERPRHFVVRSNLPIHAESRPDTSYLPSDAILAGVESVPTDPQPAPVRWLACLWLAGAIAIAARIAAGNTWLHFGWRPHPSNPNSEAGRRATELAAQLGLRARVRFVESNALVSPIAFGWLRPTIGLPSGFWATHSCAQRDAMLAHELAHLAARDPFWLAVTDAVTALLWWHPLVWWARRHLREASELAADEASLLVENGPAVLADCLVSLARNLGGRRANGGLGMAGFRSGLGRRVERLLSMEPSGGTFRQRTRPRLVLLASIMPVAIGMLSATALAWSRTADGAPAPTFLAMAMAAFASNPSSQPGTGDRTSARADGLSLAADSREVPSQGKPVTQAEALSGPPPKPDWGGETAPAPSPTSVAALVNDGKLLYELGNTAEAKLKFEAALKREPMNAAVHYYLKLIREAEFKRERRDLATSERKEESGLLYPTLPPIAAPGETAASPATNQLFTRSYRVNPSVLQQSLEKMSGSGTTNVTPYEALRRLFIAAGVELGEPGATNVFPGSTDVAASRSASRKALFLNDRAGILLARATLADLDLIEQLLQVLNATPPQVLIEARFVEITQDTAKAMGFGWFLGNQPMGGTTITGSNAGPMTLTGLMTDPQFRSGVHTLETGGTNGVRELRGDELDWAGRNATNAQNMRVNAALGATLTGILTEPQFRLVLRALEQRSGVDVLSAPKVTTLSERQAQIQVANIRSIVTGIDPAALVQPGARPGTNVSPFTITQLPAGPVLDVIPVVSADGYTIQLTVTATVSEFLGYDPAQKDGKVRVWQDGKARWVDTPLPRFRVRQVQTKAALWDGQTLVLGAYPVEDQVHTKDKVPVLGDIPGLGRWFRSESKSTVRKQLLVFVTATIIDPAGNRVHTADNLPYDPSRMPPQPAR